MAAWAILLTTAGVGIAAAQQPLKSVKEVRFVSLGDTTRVVVELSGEVEYRVERIEGPDRVFFDLRGAVPRRNGLSLNVGDQTLKRIRLGENQPGVSRLVFDIESPDVEYKVTRLSNPERLIVEFARTASDRMILTPAKELLADAAPASSKIPPAALPSMPEVEPETEIVYPPFVPPAVKPRPARRPVIITAEPRVTPPAASRQPLTQGPLMASNQVLFPNVRPRVPEAAPLPPPPPVQVAKPGPVQEKPAPALIVAKKPDQPYSYKPKDTTKGPYPTEQAVPGVARPDASMVRALGLKIGRIAIDPGHGGQDFGATGPTGLLEKDVTLDVSRRLADLLQRRLGAEVVLLRNDDTAISPEQRTEMANESRADLFISIHTNSSVAASATGIETFYLNFTGTPGASEVAARENASSQKQMHEMQGLLEKIALNTKLNESREFAARVHRALVADTKSLDRGVKRAPFIVLVGAQMPAILVELGFLSNPREEQKFRQPAELQRIAESLFRGISSYAASLGQVEVAHRSE
jgi:N-acetylmuramoyl-L-alanine amidase